MAGKNEEVVLQKLIDSVMNHITNPLWAAITCDIISTAYTAGYLDSTARRKPQNGLFIASKNDPRRQVTPEDITNEIRRIGIATRNTK